MVVLCVFTATTFWLLNALNKDNYTTTVNQPISILYDTEEYMAVEEVPQEVGIQINGNGWDLLKRHLKISVTPLEVFLEDPFRKPFLLASELAPQMQEHIASSDLITIVPDTLNFKIDRIVSKKIRLAPDTTANTLAENHAFASPISIEPEVVTVTGPISIIEQMEGKLLLGFGETNIRENFSRLLPLTLKKEQQAFLRLDEETAQVSFEVVAFVENRLTLQIQQRYFPENVTVDTDITELEARFLIQEDKQAMLNELELSAVLNYNNRNREDSTISASLNKTPEYIRNIRFEPETFKLIYDE
ncbi:YbbR-like domain-containing protein [Cyclobacterium xiamenense]|uniref:YbbR-like domain-containing protein n=1 Tax=Cyclobacterium xiamenense TaxID=1297121 RepID=UPI0035D02517